MVVCGQSGFFPPLARVWAQDQPTFSTDVKVVSLLATVHDQDGRIVKDLGAPESVQHRIHAGAETGESKMARTAAIGRSNWPRRTKV
jgi:hypothetical protein